MKVVAAVLGPTLLLIGAFVAVRGRGEPAEIFLGRDGVVSLGGRRLPPGTDVAASLRGRIDQAKVLRIDVEPGAVVEDLVLLLRVAGTKSVVIRCGPLEEPLELPPWPLLSGGVLLEVNLHLCVRNDLKGHLFEAAHAESGKPGKIIATGVERTPGPPLRLPDQETPASLRAVFDRLRSQIEAINRAGPGGGPPPPKEYGFVSCCPGVPVEYALRACRAQREAGSGAPQIRGPGVGSHR